MSRFILYRCRLKVEVPEVTEDKEEKNCYISRYKALFTNAEDMIFIF